MKHRHIAGERHHYCAWPGLVRAQDGSLIVSYCRSEEHVAPNGEVQIVRSTDNGESWSSPIVVRDSLIDDRECGMTPLSDGRILMHVWSTFNTPEMVGKLNETSYRQDVIAQWKAHIATSEYRSAESEHGGWVYVSEDNGLSWKNKGRGPDTIHGGIQLASGAILLVSYRTTSPAIGVHRADPADLNWKQITVYKPPHFDDLHFGEPHLVQLASGRVVMMLRATASPYNDRSEKNHLWVSWSDDEGLSWTEARPTELLGFPPHLLRLSDGRILCTYGRRCEPYGERACISEDGIHWDLANERILRDDADNVDLGYPASIELEPGRILTVYYQSPHVDPPACMNPPDPLRRKPDILGTIWNL